MQAVRPPGSARRTIRGQVLVEFAIVFPLLILLFAVLVNFGDVMMHHISVQTALREGARIAIEYKADDARIAEAMLTASSALAIKREEITIERTKGDGNVVPGQKYSRLRLAIHRHHDFIIPYLANGQPGTEIGAALTTYVRE